MRRIRWIQTAAAGLEMGVTETLAAKGGRIAINAIFALLEMVASRVGHGTSKWYMPTAMSGQRKSNKTTWLGWQRRGGASSYESTLTKWLVDSG